MSTCFYADKAYYNIIIQYIIIHMNVYRALHRRALKGLLASSSTARLSLA